MLDLIIVGAGPAGLSAAVYAKRAELKFVIIDSGMMQGGQVLNTSDVDNYLGLPGIGGFEMGKAFSDHVKKLGVDFITERVVSTDITSDIKKVITEKNTYEAKTLIIATGAVHKKGGVPGEDEFTGRGVSYCATCDGAFFRNKVTVVVGGGNVALEDALYLSRLCTKVYLIHRRDSFRGAKSTLTILKNIENVEIITDAVVTKIEGENKVERITVDNLKTKETMQINTSGVFFAVGMDPSHGFIEGLKEDESGFIVAGEDCQTSVRGVYVAGDLRTKPLRQIATAVSDGAYAVDSVEKYLQ